MRIIIFILAATLVLAILYYIPLKTSSADEMGRALSDANDRLDALLQGSSFSNNNSSESVNSNTTNSTTSGNRTG